jgi:GNAT superfamily N-acetyltransferase
MSKISDTAISFELAQISDLPALSALLTLLFSQEHEFTPDTAAQQRGLTGILEQPDTGRILVARHHGEVIAMVSILFSTSTALGGRVALLEDMVVNPSYRGQGIGSQLLEYAISFARAEKVLRMTLLTDHDNVTAQNFYQQHGVQPSSMQAWRLIL